MMVIDAQRLQDLAVDVVDMEDVVPVLALASLEIAAHVCLTHTVEPLGYYAEHTGADVHKLGIWSRIGVAVSKFDQDGFPVLLVSDEKG